MSAILGYVVYNDQAQTKLQNWGILVHQIAVRPQFYRIFSYTNVFDNKKNPIKDLSFGSITLPNIEITDPNNLTSQTSTSYTPQGTVQNTSTSSSRVFEYNAHDYPSKITAADGTYWVFTYQCP